ncbi:MAG TPA: hypothetical protein VHJ00_16550, partial [Bradyrhizobium sp.]|nr:hypothetical protein [Bradyrhizobium sp.]
MKRGMAATIRLIFVSGKAKYFFRRGWTGFWEIDPSRLGKNGLAFGVCCTLRFMTNRAFKTGESREQPSLLPPRIDDYVGP